MSHWEASSVLGCSEFKLLGKCCGRIGEIIFIDIELCVRHDLKKR